MIELSHKLRALSFPAYFLRFIERSSAGGLEFLLRVLSESEIAELLRFEQEFRQGYKFEQMNDLGHALNVYQQLLRRYPRFAFLIDEHLAYNRELHKVEFAPPAERPV